MNNVVGGIDIQKREARVGVTGDSVWLDQTKTVTSSYTNMNRFCSPVSPFLWRQPSCSNTTSCHDAVDLSMCFEDTAVLYSILLLFWFFAGLVILGGCYGTKNLLPFSIVHGTKLFLLLPLLLTSLCDLCYSLDRRIRGNEVAGFQYLSPILLFSTSVLVAVVMHRDRRSGHRTSGLLLVFWLLLSLYGSFKLRTYILVAMDANEVADIFRLTTFCFQYVTFIAQLVLSTLPEPKAPKKYELKKPERLPAPEEDATFLSQITWWWQNRLIWQGWRHPLVYNDLHDLLHRDKSSEVATRFMKNWGHEVQRARTEENQAGSNISAKINFFSPGVQREFRFQKLNTLEEDNGGLVSTTAAHPRNNCCDKLRPSLVFALAKTLWRMLLFTVLFKLGQDLLAFAGPQLLKLMIRFTQDDSLPDWRGYFYAVLMFVAPSLQSLFLQQYFYRCSVIGMNIRTAIIAAIYSKALRLSNKARQASTVGEIVNLMSVDAQRLMDVMKTLNLTWSAPLQIILALIFLYMAMGPSIFAGFAVMVMMIPLNVGLASQAHKLQARQMSEKDSRIKLVNEVLNGIKVIKLYAWEAPFKKFISTIRSAELSILKKAAILNSFTAFTWTCAPFFVALITFATYALVNADNPEERLTADKAFVALALFNLLRFPLTMLPVVVTSLVQASVSIKRLRNFLQTEELDSDAIEWASQLDIDDDFAVSLEGASFSWDEEEQDTPTLKHLDLRVKPRQLVAVVGPVGSGKSSLIQAVLGEMDKLGGHVQLKGSVAYVPQQAWIQNATLQDNILFGKRLEKCCYSQVIKSCALKDDLDLLPGGDMTEIGGKGINLSGGQKQRVSLARAVYQNADIYLLDDPLSAVDSHVGKHIFEKVIGPNGILKHKVRIMVTHGTSFLPQCDLIVVMLDGRITEVGSYSALIKSKRPFAEFLMTYSSTEEDDTKVQGDEKCCGNTSCGNMLEKPSDTEILCYEWPGQKSRQSCCQKSSTCSAKPFSKISEQPCEKLCSQINEETCVKPCCQKPNDSCANLCDQKSCCEDLCQNLCGQKSSEDSCEKAYCQKFEECCRKGPCETAFDQRSGQCCSEDSCKKNFCSGDSCEKKSGQCCSEVTCEKKSEQCHPNDLACSRQKSENCCPEDSCAKFCDQKLEKCCQKSKNVSSPKSGRKAGKPFKKLTPISTAYQSSMMQCREPCCSSSASVQEFEEEDNTNCKSSKVTTTEEVKTGRVHFSIVLAYCKACTWPMSIITFLFFLFGYASSVGGNFWLAAWSNAEGHAHGTNFTQTTACDGVNDTSTGCYIGVYASFGLVQALFVFLSSFGIAVASYFASRSLHNKMLDNILLSPMSFFDATPVGRILNRFSKDMNIIDETIPQSVRSFLMNCFTVLTTLLVVAVTSPIFISVVIPMAVIYFMIQRLYVATTRQLKRLESISRSPIYSHFQESLLGVTSIRAYQQQERFMLESEKKVDYNHIAYYPSINANRWLAVRLEFIGNLIIFSAAIFAALQRNLGEELGLHISPGVVGLSLSYALTITECFNCVVRMISELETHIVAVERTKEYAETPREALHIVENNRPDPDWPSEGKMVFDHFSTRYSEDLDLVLHDLSVDIPGGSKVGIVGRTGAGKSSLTLALFRIIESAGGRILVDGMNIADLGLHDLRSRITIIPQDPFLFSGSVRTNLDPFEIYKDEEIWRVLDCTHLRSFVSTQKEGLHFSIVEGGENLSMGQRQLVCLARALLRKTKILVLDESTAAVDLETDDLIQKTIRAEFAHCTVITIAHRLNTIMDYDKIMLLDNGQIKEFASPSDLLEDRNSRFYSMAKDAGLV